MVIRIKINGEWVDFLKKTKKYTQPNVTKILKALNKEEKNERKKRNNR